MTETRTPWIRLSRGEKLRRSVERRRAPTSRCLLCGAQVMPADHGAHRARCQGHRAPHHLDAWLTEAEAAERLDLETLRRLGASGRIRTRDGEYLLRDIETTLDAIELLK